VPKSAGLSFMAALVFHQWGCHAATVVCGSGHRANYSREVHPKGSGVALGALAPNRVQYNMRMQLLGMEREREGHKCKDG
jgi:hypothetical protein